jgi:hypothetical protein
MIALSTHQADIAKDAVRKKKTGTRSGLNVTGAIQQSGSAGSVALWRNDSRALDPQRSGAV